jgi:hypothetical protein
VRKWFPSEFTWRLYVVLQVVALMAFAFLVLALLADGELLQYRSVYEEVEFDLANVEAKCARGEGGKIFHKYSLDPRSGQKIASVHRLRNSASPRREGVSWRKIQRCDLRPDLVRVGLRGAVRCGEGADLALGGLA